MEYEAGQIFEGYNSEYFRKLYGFCPKGLCVLTMQCLLSLYDGNFVISWKVVVYRSWERMIDERTIPEKYMEQLEYIGHIKDIKNLKKNFINNLEIEDKRKLII